MYLSKTNSSFLNAAKALKSYILLRLVRCDEDQWTEVAVVTLIWIVTIDTANSASFEPSELESYLDDVSQAWRKSLGCDAAHGALIVCGSYTSC